MDKIFTRVGAFGQHFAGRIDVHGQEMLESASILNNISSAAWCCSDEIDAGRKYHDGISIAWAMVK